MKKNLSSLLLAAEPKKVSQIYPDTYLKAYTHDHHLRVGETRTGELTMTEENEKFEFVEKTPEVYTRNPKVFQGEYLNVHLDKFGALVVTLRRTELTNRKNAVRDGEAIKTELLTAAKVLGV
ncbi:MAG: hypothetical protein IJQ18_07690 [Paludibacteraceae bacterium]|jgi:hypothetical protein|nr:hypothetical protein [Paludibacteraceae bacterium]